MDLGLAGRACVVTGATRGIGLASSRMLVAEGARVLLVARDRGEGARVTEEIGGGCEFFAADVTAPDAGDRIVRACVERLGGVDVEQPRFAAAPAAAQHAAAGASWDVSAVPAEDLATVRAFLERRNSLASGARMRLAAQLDGALRPRVGGADVTDPERFLEILYDAKRARG